MTNKFNQLLEIKFCNSLLATLRLETPDFISKWYHSMVRCKSYGPLNDEC